MKHVVSNNLFSNSEGVLEESLNLRLQRHLLTTQNLTHSQTPGYRAMALDFESQLQAAVGDPDKLLMKASAPEHIRAPGISIDGVLRPDLYMKPTESVGEDGNTVDVDQEMTEMAANQIVYRATVEILNRKFGMLKYGMNGGR